MRNWSFSIRVGLVLLILAVAIVLSIDVLGDWKQMLLDVVERTRSDPRMLAMATIAYAFCLAVPFVPGVELGLLLMVTFGKSGVVMAYAGTLLGLNLAFAAGWLLRRRLIDWPQLVGWRDQARSLDRFGERSLVRTAWGRRLIRWLNTPRRRGRYYLLVAALLNLPGNTIVGGGGGISLVSGLSGRLNWLGFALTVMLATASIPLLVLLGIVELEQLLL